MVGWWRWAEGGCGECECEVAEEQTRMSLAQRQNRTDASACSLEQCIRPVDSTTLKEDTRYPTTTNVEEYIPMAAIQSVLPESHSCPDKIQKYSPFGKRERYELTQKKGGYTHNYKHPIVLHRPDPCWPAAYPNQPWYTQHNRLQRPCPW